jgi:uncharacterized protein YciI
MPFLIDATDKPNSSQLRADKRPLHLAYLDKNVARFLAVGAKLRDDGTTAWGSLYLINTEDRAEAEAFIRDDPYSQVGLFENVAMTRCRTGYFNFAKVPPKP